MGRVGRRLVVRVGEEVGGVAGERGGEPFEVPDGEVAVGFTVADAGEPRQGDAGAGGEFSEGDSELALALADDLGVEVHRPTGWMVRPVR